MGDHALGVALAQRAVDVARLAEAAALHAAAHHLDAGAVVHHAEVRDDGIRRRREGVEVREHALRHDGALRIERNDLGDGAVLAIAGCEERRHVDTRQRGQRAQQGRAIAITVAVLANRVDDLPDDLLAVAQHDGVEEGREGLGIERAGTAGDHQRVVGTALGALRSGMSAQLEHGQQVGVGELVLQAEADDVEVAQGQVALERDERQSVRSQQRFQSTQGA